MRNRGSESALKGEQRQELEEWLGAQETIPLNQVRDEIEERSGFVSQATPSDYD